MDKYAKQIRNFLACIAVILFAAILKATSSFSITLVFSLFVYIFFLPLCIALERMKVPAVVATVLSVILMVVVVCAGFAFAGYSADLLIRTAPGFAPKIVYLDDLLVHFLRRWIDLPKDFSLLGLNNIDWISGVLIPGLKTVSGSAINLISNLFITILMSTFLIVERHSIYSKMEEIAKPGKKDRVKIIFDRIYKQVSKYLALKLVISLITGLIFYLICRYVGIELAVIIGVLTFVLNFIPNIGSIVITVITILIAVLQFVPNWTPILIVAAGTITTQMVLGNILEPRLQGSQLNLSAFVILVSLSISGYIWGIAGTFLAVPILSVLEIIMANMESTKGIALAFSSGASFKKKKRQDYDSDRVAEPYDDVMLPDEQHK